MKKKRPECKLLNHEQKRTFLTTVGNITGPFMVIYQGNTRRLFSNLGEDSTVSIYPT